MSITKEFLSRTNRIQAYPEVSDPKKEFQMFNDAGTEIEVSEFIWALTRIMKPEWVLETGTHKGVSSSYIARALEDNAKGRMFTFEIIDIHRKDAIALWLDLGLSHRIDSRLQDSLSFDPGDIVFDMLVLDSEPQLRFNEFIKFLPYLRPGGIIVIHDLHPNLGHHGQIYHGEYDWPWGDFRVKLGPYIKDHLVQTVSFPTPRGLTVFQKRADDFAFTNHILGTL